MRRHHRQQEIRFPRPAPRRPDPVVASKREPETRGVYAAPHRESGGGRRYYAVDSCGERFVEVTLRAEASPAQIEQAGEWLWRMLEAMDPVAARPCLRVLR